MGTEVIHLDPLPLTLQVAGDIFRAYGHQMWTGCVLGAGCLNYSSPEYLSQCDLKYLYFVYVPITEIKLANFLKGLVASDPPKIGAAYHLAA